MTAHDEVSRSGEPEPGAHPSEERRRGRVGPDGANGGSGRRARDVGAPGAAAAPAYDDGDSRVFLEGDG